MLDELEYIIPDIQDLYVHMSPEKLYESFLKGAYIIWEDIFDNETIQILLRKILWYQKEDV